MFTLYAAFVAPALAGSIDHVGPLNASVTVDAAYGHRRGPPPRYGRRGPPPPPRYGRRGPPPRPEDEAVVELEPATRAASLTVDAIDLSRGEVSVGAELALDARDGLLIRGGLGATEGQALYHLGLEGRRYFLGSFDAGLFVGLRAEFGDDHLFLPHDAAFSVGPTLGGKLTLPRFPLTLEASIGGDLVAHPGFLALAPRAGVGVGFSF